MSAQTDLKVRLKNHDWFFEYSDDLRVFRAGVLERMEIVAELKKLPMAEAKELITAFAPKQEMDGMIKRLERLD